MWIKNHIRILSFSPLGLVWGYWMNCGCRWQPHPHLNARWQVINGGQNRFPAENLRLLGRFRDHRSLRHCLPHRLWVPGRWIWSGHGLRPHGSSVQGIGDLRQEPPSKEELPGLGFDLLGLAYVLPWCFICFAFSIFLQAWPEAKAHDSVKGAFMWRLECLLLYFVYWSACYFCNVTMDVLVFGNCWE